MKYTFPNPGDKLPEILVFSDVIDQLQGRLCPELLAKDGCHQLENSGVDNQPGNPEGHQLQTIGILGVGPHFSEQLKVLLYGRLLSGKLFVQEHFPGEESLPRRLELPVLLTESYGHDVIRVFHALPFNLAIGELVDCKF